MAKNPYAGDNNNRQVWTIDAASWKRKEPISLPCEVCERLVPTYITKIEVRRELIRKHHGGHNDAWHGKTSVARYQLSYRCKHGHDWKGKPYDPGTILSVRDIAGKVYPQ